MPGVESVLVLDEILTHTHADGIVAQAENLADVIAKCPAFAGMSPEDTALLLGAAAQGRAINEQRDAASREVETVVLPPPPRLEKPRIVQQPPETIAQPVVIPLVIMETLMTPVAQPEREHFDVIERAEKTEATVIVKLPVIVEQPIVPVPTREEREPTPLAVPRRNTEIPIAPSPTFVVEATTVIREEEKLPFEIQLPPTVVSAPTALTEITKQVLTAAGTSEEVVMETKFEDTEEIQQPATFVKTVPSIEPVRATLELMSPVEIIEILVAPKIEQPPVVPVLIETITAATPEVIETIQPLLVAVIALQQTMTPENRNEIHIAIEEAVIELFESPQLPYEPQDIKAFITYLEQVDLTQVTESSHSTADLEHDGTREAKRHLPQLLGLIVQSTVGHLGRLAIRRQSAMMSV